MQVDFKVLYRKVQECLLHEGCSSDQAKNVTHSLIMAEVCGVPTHGLRMLSDHILKIRNGFYEIDASLTMEKETMSFSQVDCHGMVGMDSAVKCMQLAIDRCKGNGIHIVFAKNANTYSAAFVYTLQAASQGFIGITMSNAPAKMPAYGGRKKLLGTNPLSYAIPSNKENPILFDMATSVVAQSKINMAKDRGEDIPIGWALDSDGKPTTNAMDACRGMILPMAGPKGYGLSMMIDLLAGLLSGAAYLDGVGRFYNDRNECMNVGQLFIAIDPVAIYGDGFYLSVDDYIRKVKSSETQGDGKVCLPGEHKFDKMKESLSKGVNVPDDLCEQLKQYGIALHGRSGGITVINSYMDLLTCVGIV